MVAVAIVVGVAVEVVVEIAVRVTVVVAISVAVGVVVAVEVAVVVEVGVEVEINNNIYNRGTMALISATGNRVADGNDDRDLDKFYGVPFCPYCDHKLNDDGSCSYCDEQDRKFEQRREREGDD